MKNVFSFFADCNIHTVLFMLSGLFALATIVTFAATNKPTLGFAFLVLTAILGIFGVFAMEDNDKTIDHHSLSRGRW